MVYVLRLDSEVMTQFCENIDLEIYYLDFYKNGRFERDICKSLVSGQAFSNGDGFCLKSISLAYKNINTNGCLYFVV